MESYGIEPLRIGSFHSAEFFGDSCRLPCIYTLFHFIADRYTQYKCVYLGLFNHSPFNGHLGCFWVWLSIKSCSGHLHTDFYGNMFSFLWNACPSTQLLGCMVVACLVLQGTATLFPRVIVSFTFCQQCMSDVHSPHLHWHLRLSLLFILAILIGV